jgi:hypothetical protein
MVLTVSAIYTIASRERLWVVAWGRNHKAFQTKQAAVNNGRRFAASLGATLVVA